MYTVKEAAEKLGITPRAVTMRCRRDGVKKKGKSYLIPLDVLNQWKNGGENTKQKEVKEDTEEKILEEFSTEQYEMLQKVIHEYPQLLKRLEEQTDEIKYLRGEVTNLINSNNGLIKTLQQTNLLQAKDKGYE